LQGERENCLAAGMDDYASKPVVQETLQILIEKWLPNKLSPTNKIPHGVHFDQNALANILGNNTITMDLVLNNTKNYLASVIPDLHKAMADNDEKSIKFIAHKLKGTAAYVQLPRLAALATNLEVSLDKKHTAQLTNDIAQEIAYLNTII
jgi:HPt (histidine-containing phosphotransfer) domain-containing protein